MTVIQTELLQWQLWFFLRYQWNPIFTDTIGSGIRRILLSCPAGNETEVYKATCWKRTQEMFVNQNFWDRFFKKMCYFEAYLVKTSASLSKTFLQFKESVQQYRSWAQRFNLILLFRVTIMWGVSFRSFSKYLGVCMHMNEVFVWNDQNQLKSLEAKGGKESNTIPHWVFQSRTTSIQTQVCFKADTSQLIYLHTHFSCEESMTVSEANQPTDGQPLALKKHLNLNVFFLC